MTFRSTRREIRMLPTHRKRIQIVTKNNFLMAIWFWLVVVVLVWLPQASFAYDGLSQTKPAYDSGREPADSYDAVSALTTHEKKNGTTGNGVPFAQFAKFLAASNVATPHGAAVQATTAEAQYEYRNQ